MAFVIITTIIVIGTVLFNLVTPWWFTPLASNWGSLDQTIIITLWVTGVAFVLPLNKERYGFCNNNHHHSYRDCFI